VSTRSKQKDKPQKKSSRISLIQSESATPAITVRAGMKVSVEEVTVVRPDGTKPEKIAARLCSGGGNCIALVSLED
jgi:hypothetical protein